MSHLKIGFSQRVLGAVSCATMAGLFFTGSALAISPEEALRNFSKCDSSFFTSETIAALNPGSLLPVVRGGSYAWFKPNSKTRGNAVIDFPHPLKVGGVQLLKYAMGTTEFREKFGYFYSWGFTAGGDLDDVVAKLTPIIFQNERFRKDSGAFQRTELNSGVTNWLNVDATLGVPVGTDKVLRAFVIEKGNTPGQVNITCSMQGGVSASILGLARPDLDVLKYPTTAAPELADQMPVAPKVEAAIDALVKELPQWKPRFSTLRYTMRFGTDIENHQLGVRGNYVYVIESLPFKVRIKRTTWANLIPTKAAIERSEGTFDLFSAQNAVLSFPRALTHGAAFTTNVENEDLTSEKRGIIRKTETCSVQGQQSAQTINETLLGQAIILVCRSDRPSSRTIAFIEELGIILNLSTTTAQNETTTYQYTDMVIVK